MSQLYAAIYMYRCFTKNGDLRPVITVDPKVNIYEKNVTVNINSIKSGKLNFAEPNAINDLEFSEIVWQTVKGLNSKMPTPKPSAFVKLAREDDDN